MGGDLMELLVVAFELMTILDCTIFMTQSSLPIAHTGLTLIHLCHY